MRQGGGDTWLMLLKFYILDPYVTFVELRFDALEGWSVGDVETSERLLSYNYLLSC